MSHSELLADLAEGILITDYIVVEAANSTELRARVKLLLDQGYQPVGGPSVVGQDIRGLLVTNYSQAMTRGAS